MDIAGLSMSLSTAKLGMGVELAMLSRVLDTAEQTGEVLTEMMDSVPIAGLGEYIDIRV